MTPPQEQAEIEALLSDPENAIDASAVRAEAWLDRNANHIDGMPHGNALSQLAMIVPILRLLVLSQRKRRKSNELASLRADLQRLREENDAIDQQAQRSYEDARDREAELEVALRKSKADLQRITEERDAWKRQHDKEMSRAETLETDWIEAEDALRDLRHALSELEDRWTREGWASCAHGIHELLGSGSLPTHEEPKP